LKIHSLCQVSFDTYPTKVTMKFVGTDGWLVIRKSSKIFYSLEKFHTLDIIWQMKQQQQQQQ